MSKAGIIMAAAVAIALVGAGTGVYFFLDQDQAVGIEIKDQFEVGDKHISVTEWGTIMYEISNVTKVGEDLKFDVYENGGSTESDITYDDLREYILHGIAFDASSIDAIEGDETRTSTAFGDRDCVVYTHDNEDGSKEIYYVGKDNNVVYKREYMIDDVITQRYILQKSSLLLESNTDIGLKEAGEIKESESILGKIVLISTLIIEGVTPSDGDTPVTYDVRILGEGSGNHLTHDEILEMVNLALPDLDDSEKGVVTEGVRTSLGKVNCDVYTYAAEPFFEFTFYISNDILVMLDGTLFGSAIRTYWEYTDLVVRS